jgi:(S)-mandelate dehydrogenase
VSHPLAEWRRRALNIMPGFASDYLEGGSDAEITVRRNQLAMSRWLFMPRSLRDVSQCDLSGQCFGQPLSLPLGIAPMGMNGLFWRQGDLALARAAATVGIPFCLSTASSSTIEELAAISNLRKWFQLYVLEDRRISEMLLDRAQSAGFEALLLTVDVPVSGNRVRDARNGLSFPLRFKTGLVLDALRHPRWVAQTLRGGLPGLANLNTKDAVAALGRRAFDSSFTWKDLAHIRERWPGPLILKGILSADDACIARDHGIDALVVSNHGGRQLDGTPGSIEVLASVVEAAADVDVLIDGGFRSGGDVV